MDQMDCSPWHVITTSPGHSVKVARRLQFISGFSPLQEILIVTKALQKTIRRIPLFPKYVFARWDAQDPHLWHVIKDTRNVTGILGGEHPVPVKPGEIEKLIAKCDADWVHRSLRPVEEAAALEIGSTVRLSEGPWQGYNGQVDSWDVKKLLVGVEISFLGRRLVVEVPPSWCEKVGSASHTTFDNKNKIDRRPADHPYRRRSRRPQPALLQPFK